jgi:hypothetical protein
MIGWISGLGEAPSVMVSYSISCCRERMKHSSECLFDMIIFILYNRAGARKQVKALAETHPSGGIMTYKLSKHATVKAQQRGVSAHVLGMVVKYGHAVRMNGPRGCGRQDGLIRLVSCTAKSARLMEKDGIAAQIREKAMRAQMIQAGDGTIITVLSPGHRVRKQQLCL